MTESNTYEYVTYILARSDLSSLNAGKLAAQVHHAGVQMAAKYSNNDIMKNYIAQGLQHGADYFNTTIVLAATIGEINGFKSFTYNFDKLASLISDIEFITDDIIDPSYPFIVQNHEVAKLIPSSTAKYIKTFDNGQVLMVRKELTCTWVLVKKPVGSKFELLDHLKLYP